MRGKVKTPVCRRERDGREPRESICIRETQSPWQPEGREGAIAGAAEGSGGGAHSQECSRKRNKEGVLVPGTMHTLQNMSNAI